MGQGGSLAGAWDRGDRLQVRGTGGIACRCVGQGGSLAGAGLAARAFRAAVQWSGTEACGTRGGGEA